MLRHHFVILNRRSFSSSHIKDDRDNVKKKNKVQSGLRAGSRGYRTPILLEGDLVVCVLMHTGSLTRLPNSNTWGGSRRYNGLLPVLSSQSPHQTQRSSNKVNCYRDTCSGSIAKTIDAAVENVYAGTLGPILRTLSSTLSQPKVEVVMHAYALQLLPLGTHFFLFLCFSLFSGSGQLTVVDWVTYFIFILFELPSLSLFLYQFFDLLGKQVPSTPCSSPHRSSSMLARSSEKIESHLMNLKRSPPPWTAFPAE